MNIDASSSRHHDDLLALGCTAIDRRLRGGLLRAGLHEIISDEADAAAAAGFTFLLALRAAGAKPIFIVRDERCVRALGRVHGSGIAALGGDPASVVVVHTDDTRATLRAAADVAASSSVGAVIIETWREARELDLTASRKLALRATHSGVFALALRTGWPPSPSAAATRWRVKAALSSALAANAPGAPAFDVGLLRHRNGIAGFDARVEWDGDQRMFRDAPLPSVVPAVAVGRGGDQEQRRAA